MKNNKTKVVKSTLKPRKFKSLTLGQLCSCCDPKKFKFKSTQKIPKLNEIIGQERAVHALEFGLEIKDHGYHIYALGPSGTGKATTIRKYLEIEAKNQETPPDWLYIHNFDDSDKPKTLQLPAGKGREFRDDIDQLVVELKTEVPKAFEGEAYGRERQSIEKEFHNQSEQLFTALTQKASERGFQLIQTTQGFAVVPMINNKVLTPKEHAALDEKKRTQIKNNQEKLIAEVHEAMRELEQLQKEVRQKMRELDQRVVSFSVSHLITALKEKYRDYPDVIQFLIEVQNHLLKNVTPFKQIKQTEGPPIQEQLMMLGGGSNEITFDEYRVNLIVDNSKTEGAPVIFEKNPIGPNLIGRIEQQGLFGALVTNFRMIKGGALHRANGGYLVLEMLSLLKKPFAWEMLKRALKNREIVIENMMESLGAFTTRTLEPMPIPLATKVILIGNPMFYYLIYEYDPEFKELFKVKADFAGYMERNNQTDYQYAQFIGMVCEEEKLNHFAPSGVAKIIEYGSRLVAHQQKVTTKFGDIVDIIRQAAFWARKHRHQLVVVEDVQKALDEKIYRSNRIEEVMREMVAEKTIKISTTGSVVGQINGISVLSLGDYSFGKPSRITAQTYVGGDGLVSIEREIKMGGPIHNKASLIIAGYLGGKYAQDVPMALSASITFEQVYEEIEGDSASAAEIFVLLSSLSGYPIRQDLAITGSVNQHGEIQAIGGVNEKIEGVFQVCKLFGLTGKQGVIIPESNVQHLMLNDEVLNAVKKGQFHIYSIAMIDEGIELLTGKPAGVRKADGLYPKDTVNFAVQNKISELAKKAVRFHSKKDKAESEKKAAEVNAKKEKISKRKRKKAKK